MDERIASPAPAAEEARDPATAHTHTAAPNRQSTSSSHAHHHPRDTSHKEPLDPALDIDLPYRTLTRNAQLAEYTVETAGGELPAAPSHPRHTLVTFTPGDAGNPKNWSKAYKWYCTMVVALTCFVVAFASAVVTANIPGVADEFGVSEEVALLSVSLFVVGFGVGPMMFAPLSEIYGRRVI